MCLFSFVHDYKTDEMFFGPSLSSHSEVKQRIPNLTARINQLVDIEWPEFGQLLIRAESFDESRLTLKNVLKRWKTREALVEYIEEFQFSGDKKTPADLTKFSVTQIWTYLNQNIMSKYIKSDYVTEAFKLLNDDMKYNALINSFWFKKLEPSAARTWFRDTAPPVQLLVIGSTCPLIELDDRVAVLSKIPVEHVLGVMQGWSDLTMEHCLELLKNVKGHPHERNCRRFLNVSMLA
jgi:hypothetical protein